MLQLCYEWRMEFSPLFLADLLLWLHTLIIAGAVLPVPLVIIGKCMKWQWIYGNWFRFGHLGLIAFVVVNTWFGNLCPLTIWESNLRIAAGEKGYSQSFVSTWFSQLIYIDLPSYVFAIAYSAFGLLVLFLLWWAPPHYFNKRQSQST